MNRSNFRGLIKKAAAVALSMIMAFGAVSVLPNSFVKDNAIVAHAEKDRSKMKSVTANDCIFYFNFRETPEDKSIIIEDCDILNDEGIVDIPSSIISDGVEYPVTHIGFTFLYGDQKVKNVIMPDSVNYISHYVLEGSSIESLTLPANLEEIEQLFCSYCPSLKRENVKYNGTKLKRVGKYVFGASPGMINSKGAICLKNWLVRYEPTDGPTKIKIADLADNGEKIDAIASAASFDKSLTSVDLEGIKIICDEAFTDHKQLSTVLNYDDIANLGNAVFTGTPWLEKEKESGLARMGEVLLYYKSDSKVIDLTKGDLAGVTLVRDCAFADCVNADTLVVSSDVKMGYDCFYEAYKQPVDDIKHPDKMPLISTHKIKDIYLDGKKLEYSKETPVMPEWVKIAYPALIGTEWVKINCEAKTKDLCEQLDIPYYGMNNDKVGTHTPTEEFYIMLKVHEYLSIYDYDHNYEFRGAFGAFLLGGYVDCQGYADLAHYLFECSGVESKSIYNVSTGYHVWNSARVGDEWFETDNGWDAQNGLHNYLWFGLSSDRITSMDSRSHAFEHACDSWHISLVAGYEETEASVDRVVAARTLGDINGDGVKDQTDVDKLWDYIKGNISLKDTKAADINFDGVVDITDGVLLENFVNGTAVDNDNIPDDRLAAGYRAVFANSRVPEEIDTTSFVRVTTDRYRYIELPEVMYDIPEGKKFGGWDYGQAGKPGKAGQKVQISNPYTVITPVWKDESEPDDVDYVLGDVDGSGTIDISDVSKLINHINGVKALDEEEFLRADVNKSNTVEISDASAIVNHINGVKAIEGTV